MISAHGVRAWFDAPRYRREDAIRALEDAACGHPEGCTCEAATAWAAKRPMRQPGKRNGLRETDASEDLGAVLALFDWLPSDLDPDAASAVAEAKDAAARLRSYLDDLEAWDSDEPPACEPIASDDLRPILELARSLDT